MTQLEEENARLLREEVPLPKIRVVLFVFLSTTIVGWEIELLTSRKEDMPITVELCSLSFTLFNFV